MATPEVTAEEDEWTSSLPAALAEDVTEDVEQLSLARGTPGWCMTEKLSLIPENGDKGIEPSFNLLKDLTVQYKRQGLSRSSYTDTSKPG